MSAAATITESTVYSAVSCGEGPFSQRSSEMRFLRLAGAMAGAVCCRIADGVETDDHDRAQLKTTVAILNAAADAETFIRSQGRSGRRPETSFAAVAMLADIVAVHVPGEDNVQRLKALTAAVAAVAESLDPAAAQSLVPVFSRLAGAGTAGAGSPGCGTLDPFWR